MKPKEQSSEEYRIDRKARRKVERKVRKKEQNNILKNYNKYG